MEGVEKRKVREGVVVSNKMEKTVTVSVEKAMVHPSFPKVVKVRKKYYAHNPKGRIEIGQKVRIRETRPISKLKRWIVEEVLETNRIEVSVP